MLHILLDSSNVIQGLFKEKSTNQLFLTSCTYLLAEAYYLAGDFNRAISLLEELDAIPYKQVAKYLSDLADYLRCKLYLLVNRQDKIKPLFEKDFEVVNNPDFEHILYSISWHGTSLSRERSGMRSIYCTKFQKK